MLNVSKTPLDPPVVTLGVSIPLALWRRSQACPELKGVAQLRRVLLESLEKDVAAREKAAQQIGKEPS